MKTVGKSLALFPEDELAPVESHSSRVESHSSRVESHSSKVAESHSSRVEPCSGQVSVNVSASGDESQLVNARTNVSGTDADDQATHAANVYATHVSAFAEGVADGAAAPAITAGSQEMVQLARVVQPTLEEQAAIQGASDRAQCWLALKFFAFPLEVLCRDALPERATVVVADHNGRTSVIACDQQAYDLGVRTGMALAAAYALVHELEVLAQDQAQELAALERLATWAKKFTPLVSVCQPDSLLLEVHGSLTLFGGIDGLLQSVQNDLQVLGFAYLHAVAPTPTAALWLSQHEQGIALDDESLKALLGKLPIAVTAWPERVLSRLQGMGVRTLRECLRLPRDGFARRIGKQHLRELDQALGLAPDPRVNYQPPDKFVARRELLFALESVAMIMRGLDQLLVELCSFLRGRQSGIQALRITLYHAHTKASVITLGTASACRDPARLSALVHEKVEQLELPEGIVAISMVSGRLYPLTGFDGQLFSDSAHSDIPWPELVEKLRARLGTHAVTGLCLVPEHRPEQAWKYTEPGTQSDMPVTGLRPLWLLTHPHRMRNQHGLPHWHGPLTALHGPERIESGWWDGQDVARDYFVVTNPYQLMLWIYCERVASDDRVLTQVPSYSAIQNNTVSSPNIILPCDPDRQWYVHGVFA